RWDDLHTGTRSRWYDQATVLLVRTSTLPAAGASLCSLSARVLGGRLAVPLRRRLVVARRVIGIVIPVAHRLGLALGVLRLHERVHPAPVVHEEPGPLLGFHVVLNVVLVVGALGVVPAPALHPFAIDDRVFVVHDGVGLLGSAHDHLDVHSLQAID